MLLILDPEGTGLEAGDKVLDIAGEGDTPAGTLVGENVDEEDKDVPDGTPFPGTVIVIVTVDTTKTVDPLPTPEPFGITLGDGEEAGTAGTGELTIPLGTLELAPKPTGPEALDEGKTAEAGVETPIKRGDDEEA